ncbi:MAG: response regulator [Vicingaceae bacterium]
MPLILVVEDNRDINESTCEMLEMAGYEVISATTGAMGIYLTKTKKPDLIICDVWLTDMDAYRVKSILEEEAIQEDTPFVMISSSTEPSEVEKGLDAGAAAYICKPFTEDELLESVKYNLSPIEWVNN